MMPCKTAKLPLWALLEVTNVFTGSTAGPFASTTFKLKTDDQEPSKKFILERF